MKKRRVRQYDLKLAPKTLREVSSVLSSGWLATGPKVATLEKAITEHTRVRYAAAVSSATAGLQLVLESIGMSPRSEVITSPFTFVATLEAIYRAGATPILADIDPDTLNIDPQEVARKVTDRTICILPVDIAGNPSDYNELRKISKHIQRPLFTDASHSLGALYKGKTVAQLTDAAVHSLQATKNLTAGEGGIVASKHKKLVERVKLLSAHAMTSTAHQRRTSGGWAYDVVGLGSKANLSDIHAAVALGQMSVVARNETRRTKLAERYQKHLADLSDYLEIPKAAKGCRHAWHLFIIRLHLSRLKITRDRFIALMRESGVECSVHFRPIFELSFYRTLGFTERHFPNAAYAGRRVVSLPIWPGLKLTDVDYVCDQIKRLVLKHHR